MVKTLEQRVTDLEADRDRFLNALKGAAEMLLNNPMASSMLPKKMQSELREYLTKTN